MGLREWARTAISAILLSAASAAATPASDSCARCHKDIAAQQAQTAMANTWQALSTSWLPLAFDAKINTDVPYEIKRRDNAFTYSAGNFNLPVGMLVGGRRHGLGFLIPISQVGGIPLARPTLVQARYAWSPEKNELLLAPGCSASTPQSLEAALGLTLSPTFEKRCLTCHGQPGSRTSGGVHCESCHGSSSQHLANPTQGMLSPKRMSNEDSIAVCAQCHVGLTRFADPSPEDLLVANQVRAITASECFIQSGKAFSCTTCHDPHNDATDYKRAVNACLACHAATAKKRAGICPLNASGNCIGCHMPSVEMGPLHLVDHLIRVHPEQKVEAAQHAAQKSQFQPISAYLRLIVANTAEAASKARQRILAGESFYEVARDSSVDPSASIGGYQGRKPLPAGLALTYGEMSEALKSEGHWEIVERLPRDFRWHAEQLQKEAEGLAAQGDPAAAIQKSQEALKLYPRYLRALNFIGVTYAQNGNLQKGATILNLSARLYPDDGATKFALGSVLESLGDTKAAIDAYQQTIALEKDFVAAYVRLGGLFESTGDRASAIKTFRQGLQIDPLSAELNHNLGLTLVSAGDLESARRATALAGELSAPDSKK